MLAKPPPQMMMVHRKKKSNEIESGFLVILLGCALSYSHRGFSASNLTSEWRFITVISRIDIGLVKEWLKYYYLSYLHSEVVFCTPW